MKSAYCFVIISSVHYYLTFIVQPGGAVKIGTTYE